MTDNPKISSEFAHSMACAVDSVNSTIVELRKDIDTILHKQHPAWMKKINAHKSVMDICSNNLERIKSSPTPTIGLVMDIMDSEERKIGRLGIDYDIFLKYMNHLEKLSTCAIKAINTLNCISQRIDTENTEIVKDTASSLIFMLEGWQNTMIFLDRERDIFHDWLQIYLSDDAEGKNGPYTAEVPAEILKNVTSLHDNYTKSVMDSAEQAGFFAVAVMSHMRTLKDALHAVSASSANHSKTLRNLPSGQASLTPA
jgi:hypothetical protein